MGLFDKINIALHGLLIELSYAPFNLVSYVYQIFLFIAEKGIFDDDVYTQFVSKVYIILGIVLSFIIVYNILLFVIDPDKNKGGKEVENIFKKILTSFILILVMPTIFTFAMQIQKSILSTNGGVITNFFSDVKGYGDDSIKNGGYVLANGTYRAFFQPGRITSEEEATGSSTGIIDEENIKNKTYLYFVADSKDAVQKSCKGEESCSLKEISTNVDRTGKFNLYLGFSENYADGQVEVQWFLAIIAGCYLAYVIISFLFDVAVRACKLIFYEMIAPLCIACRILPKKDDIFKTWKTKIISTYLEVFIRVIILNFGVFLVTSFVDNFDNIFAECEECTTSSGVSLFATCFIILGIVTFMKQAPKLIDEIFGLGKDVKFGIKDKFKDGITPAAPLLGGAAVAGAGAQAFAHGVTDTVRNIRKSKDGAEARKSFLSGAGRTVYGTMDAQRRALMNADKVNSWSAIKKTGDASVAGADQSISNIKDAWNKAGGKIVGWDKDAKGLNKIKLNEGLVGLAGQAIASRWRQWAGVENVEEAKRQTQIAEEVANLTDAVTDTMKSQATSLSAKNKKASFGVKGNADFAMDSTRTAALKSYIGMKGDNSEFNTEYLTKLNDLQYKASLSPSGEVKIGDQTFTAKELERATNKYLGDFAKKAVEINALDEEEYQKLIHSGILSNDEVLAHEKTRSSTLKLKTYVMNNLGSQQIFTQNGEHMRQVLDKYEVIQDSEGNVHPKELKMFTDKAGNILNYENKFHDKITNEEKVLDFDYSNKDYAYLKRYIEKSYKENRPVSITNQHTGKTYSFTYDELVKYKEDYEFNLAKFQNDKNLVDEKTGEINVSIVKRELINDVDKQRVNATIKVENVKEVLDKINFNNDGTINETVAIITPEGNPFNFTSELLNNETGQNKQLKFDYSNEDYHKLNELIKMGEDNPGHLIPVDNEYYSLEELKDYKEKYDNNFQTLINDKSLIDENGEIKILKTKNTIKNHVNVGDTKIEEHQLTNAASMNHFRLEDSANGTASDASKLIKATNDEMVIPAAVEARNEKEKSTK